MAPELHYGGHRFPRYDAVIHRIGASITPYSTAVMRQFETIGTYCLNSSAGITASRDKFLARHRIGMPQTAFAASPKDTGNLIEHVGTAPLIVKLLESNQGKGVVLAETKKAAGSVIFAFRSLKANFLVQHFVREAAGEDIRCPVIGGRVVAAVKRTGAEGRFPLEPSPRRQRSRHPGLQRRTRGCHPRRPPKPGATSRPPRPQMGAPGQLRPIRPRHIPDSSRAAARASARILGPIQRQSDGPPPLDGLVYISYIFGQALERGVDDPFT